MKKFMSIFAVAGLLFGLNAHAIFPQDPKSQALLATANVTDPLPGIGNIINKTKNMLRASWSVASLGGAAGNYSMLDDQGNTALLPKGAIVTNVTWNILTGVATTNTDASVSMTLLTAGDLQAASNVASYVGWYGPFSAGTPVGTAATWKGPTTNVNGSSIYFTIVGSTLTAGSVEAFIEYVIQ